MLSEKFTILPREDIIRNSGNRESRPELLAQHQHEGRLARAHGSSDANGEGAFVPVSSFDYGHFSPKIATGTIQDFVCVPVINGTVGV